jgi:hypothetical protein
MSIRSAVPQDATRIAEVHVASWRVAYRGLMPDNLLQQLDAESRANVWRELLENPQHGFQVEGSEKFHKRSGLVEVRYALESVRERHGA